MHTCVSGLLGGTRQRLRGIFIGLAATVIALAMRPADAEAIVVGIADSEPDTFAHKDWANMNVIRLRVIVPWDIATRNDARRQEFNDWLNAFLQFKSSRPDATFSVGFQRVTDATANRGVAPTENAYRNAFRAFMSAYGTHKSYMRIGTWNEPNIKRVDSQGNSLPDRPRLPDGVHFLDQNQAPGCDAPNPSVQNCGPRMAAFYYRWAKSECPSCFFEAGNFAGHEGYDYLQKYKRHLGSEQPEVWAIHNYGDANRFMNVNDHSPDEFNAMLGELYCTTRSNKSNANLGPHHCAEYGTPAATGRLWVTATGAWYSRACKDHGDCSTQPPVRYYSEQQQCNAVAWMMRWEDIDSRLDRVYYFTYKDGNVNSPEAHDDTGVINKDGNVRKSYKVLRDRARACNY